MTHYRTGTRQRADEILRCPTWERAGKAGGWQPELHARSSSQRRDGSSQRGQAGCSGYPAGGVTDPVRY
jgi:hypothetical protein